MVVMVISGFHPEDSQDPLPEVQKAHQPQGGPAQER